MTFGYFQRGSMIVVTSLVSEKNERRLPKTFSQLCPCKLSALRQKSYLR